MNSKILCIKGWGYSMTLNSFYSVVKETPKTVTVRRIGNKIVENTGFMSGYEAPDPTCGSSITYTVRKVGNKYRGKCELDAARDLIEVNAGDKFYYNHCD